MHNDVIYKQIFGCALGSPLSSIIENVVMKEIEQTALSTCYKPQSLLVRYVDDLYAIIMQVCKNNGFLTNKRSFKRYVENHTIRTEKLKRFTSIPYSQGVSKPISRILTQVGIGVALIPHHTLS